MLACYPDIQWELRDGNLDWLEESLLNEGLGRLAREALDAGYELNPKFLSSLFWSGSDEWWEFDSDYFSTFEGALVPTDHFWSRQEENFPSEPDEDCDIEIPDGFDGLSDEEGRSYWEGPVHPVTFNKPFAVGMYPVTRGEFEAFEDVTGYRAQGRAAVRQGGTWMERTDCTWRDPGFYQTNSHPVVCVSWNDAQEYVRWLAAGGRFHPNRRRRISAPCEVPPRWCAGIEAVQMPEAARDILWIGVYTGMRLGEVTSLKWERVDLERRILRADETKTGELLKLPITRQLAEIFERRRAACEASGQPLTGWMFRSRKSGSGHVKGVDQYHAAITEAGGTKFWFHGLRNSFISVAERELLLPRSLTKRLVNQSRGSDVTEGHAADWTVEQLREPAQRVADRIDTLMVSRDSGSRRLPALDSTH